MTITTDPTTTNATTPGSTWPRSTSMRVIAIVFAIAVATVLVIAATAGTSSAKRDRTEVINVDIAEDGTRFVWDEAPVFDDGLPAYGNAFVTQGYIYEEGAIADGAGVNADGTPTHPELVLGTWTCEGHFLGDGARTETGAWVVSKQIFDFAEQPGAKQIVTEGVELVDHEVPGRRAIVGGTGRYTSASGEAIQVLHGHNDSEGVQLSMTLEVTVPK